MAAKKQKLTARAAIEKVLADNGKPMTVPAIIAAAVPLTNLAGATPGQTIYSVLYADAKRPDATFKRVDRGTFKLAPKKRPAKKAVAAK